MNGAIFYGAGYLAAGKSALYSTMVHAGAGAVSGGINAAITGGNIYQGMGVGAFSAGLAKGLNVKSLPGRMAVGAVSGGVAAELAGGSFADGAFQGAWTSAFAYLFNDSLHKLKRSDPNMYDYLAGASKLAKEWMEQFEETAPIEHAMFKKYASNHPLISDIEHFNEFISSFDSFARMEARLLLNDGCKSFYRANYGITSIIGRFIPTTIGRSIGIYSGIGTLKVSVNFAELIQESVTLYIYGPQHVKHPFF